MSTLFFIKKKLFGLYMWIQTNLRLQLTFFLDLISTIFILFHYLWIYTSSQFFCFFCFFYKCGTKK